MPRIKIKSVPKYWPGGPVSPSMITGFGNMLTESDRRNEALMNPGVYNPFDTKWGMQGSALPEIASDPFYRKEQTNMTGSTSLGQPSQQPFRPNNKGILNTGQLTNDFINPVSVTSPSKNKQPFGTRFGNTLNKISGGLSAFGPAFSKLAMGVNYIDQMKEQEKYDQWQNRMLALSTPVDTTKNRGDYDQFGIFRPADMGSKSKGIFANAYYPQQNIAEYGLEVASNMQPRFVGDVFTPSTYVAVPNIKLNISPLPEAALPTRKTYAESSDIRNTIAEKESGGNYGALPKKKDGTLASSAVGKYQFLWNQNKDWIKNVTGVSSKEDFRNNPQAQEAAFDYWDKNVLTPQA